MLKRFLLVYALCSLSFGGIMLAAPPTDPPKDKPKDPPSTTSSEGMWLPNDLNYEHMKALGLELAENEIYSESGPSIKDAIVKLGNFCTGEIISSQGLMLTNHHCAYDAIAEKSTVEHDYLTDGFWAYKKTEELPIEGLTATFLVRIEDVTEKVLGSERDETDQLTIMNRIGEIEAEATGDSDYTAEVKDVFHGAEYYLYVYEIFRDIRLVGAPPSSIGKYGGDTDNWMWPRHTGDFAMFRVYASGDNTPADYSENNVPYEPKHYLPVSLAGVEEDDYAMVMGYPGSTTRYLTSTEIDFALDQTNQDRIKLMGEKLGIMKKAMDASDEIRINMASDYASLSNYHKYLIGQSIMLKRYDIPGLKRSEESKFSNWARGAEDVGTPYTSVVNDIQDLHEGYNSTDQFFSYLNFGFFGPSTSAYAIGFYRMMNAMEGADDPSEAGGPMAAQMLPGVDEHFENFYFDVDKEIFKTMLISHYNDLSPEFLPPSIKSILSHKKAKKGKTTEEKFSMWTDWAFSTSVTTDKARAKDFLNDPSLKTLQKDPIVGSGQ